MASPGILGHDERTIHMTRLKKINRPEEAFQMAPMIDMVFLLLVFFMCVSALAQAEKKIELDLPESSESEVANNLSNRGKISLDREGTIYIAAQKHTLNEMQKLIGNALKSDPDLKILLRADRETPYREIKRVLKTCAGVGANEIIYSTYQYN